MSRRWLFIDGARAFGGHEVMLLRWMEELSRQGRVEPRLLARAETLLSERGSAFLVQGAALPPPHQSNSLLEAWRKYRSIAAAIRRERPELCIVASGHLGDVLTMLAARLAPCRTVAVYVPLVDTFKTMGYRLAWLKDFAVRAILAKLPDAWITITPDQAKAFSTWARPRGPIHCLPNAVTPSIEAKTPAHGNTPTAGKALRVLVFGRLDAHQKALDLLLDYLEATPALAGKVLVSIVGDGPYGAEIAARQRHSPLLAQTIRLAPWAEATSTMRTHDVLLLPSRFEGVPLVMLEAMALGLPIVASDLPGTRPYLHANCLFAIGDLADAFKKAQQLGDPQAHQAMCKRNREVFDATSSGKAFSLAVARLTMTPGLSPAAPAAETGVATAP